MLPLSGPGMHQEGSCPAGPAAPLVPPAAAPRAAGLRSSGAPPAGCTQLTLNVIEQHGVYLAATQVALVEEAVQLGLCGTAAGRKAAGVSGLRQRW